MTSLCQICWNLFTSKYHKSRKERSGNDLVSSLHLCSLFSNFGAFSSSPPSTRPPGPSCVRRATPGRRAWMDRDAGAASHQRYRGSTWSVISLWADVQARAWSRALCVRAAQTPAAAAPVDRGMEAFAGKLKPQPTCDIFLELQRS